MRNPRVDGTGRARARGRHLDGGTGVEAEKVTTTEVVGGAGAGAGAEVVIGAERGARVDEGTDVAVVATAAAVIATRRRRVGRGSFWPLRWRTRQRRDWASFHRTGPEGASVCPAYQPPLVRTSPWVDSSTTREGSSTQRAGSTRQARRAESPRNTRSGVIGSARRAEDTTENIARRASRAPY